MLAQEVLGVSEVLGGEVLIFACWVTLEMDEVTDVVSAFPMSHSCFDFPLFFSFYQIRRWSDIGRSVGVGLLVWR